MRQEPMVLMEQMALQVLPEQPERPALMELMAPQVLLVRQD